MRLCLRCWKVDPIPSMCSLRSHTYGPSLQCSRGCGRGGGGRGGGGAQGGVKGGGEGGVEGGVRSSDGERNSTSQSGSGDVHSSSIIVPEPAISLFAAQAVLPATPSTLCPTAHVNASPVMHESIYTSAPAVAVLSTIELLSTSTVASPVLEPCTNMPPPNSSAAFAATVQQLSVADEGPRMYIPPPPHLFEEAATFSSIVQPSSVTGQYAANIPPPRAAWLARIVQPYSGDQTLDT